MASAAGDEQPWIAMAVDIKGNLIGKLPTFFAAFMTALRRKGQNLEQYPVRSLRAATEEEAVARVDDALRGENAVSAKFLLVVDGIRNSRVREELVRNFRKQLKVFTVFTWVVQGCISDRAGADDKMQQLAQQFCSLTMGGAGTVQNAESRRALPSISGETSASSSSGQQQQRTLFPISINVIDDVLNKLENKEIAKGSSDLLRQLQRDNFIRRLNDPWPDMKRHSKLLYVTVAAASSTQADMSQMTHDFLLQVLDTAIVKLTVEKHIQPMQWDDKQRTDVGAELVDNFIKLLQLAFEQLPTKASELLIFAQLTITVLRNEAVCSGKWWPSGLTAKVDRLEAQFNAFVKQKQQVFVTASAAKKPREKIFGPPPENFRSLTVVPEKEDIVTVGDPYLRPIKRKGKYDDSEHYLDVQFRLLREDFVRPLRDGIRQYQNGGSGGGSRQANLYLYTDVHIDSPHLHKMTGEMLCTARFKAKKRTRWHKRLIGGSLVCLSMDDFHENFIFAVVYDRQVEKLAEGEVGLFFETPAQIVHDAKYRMVESSAYFEAYQHVLRGLKAIPEDEPVPFATYLVDANTDPQLPSYLRNRALVDFSSIGPTNTPKKSQMVDIRLMHERLTPEELGLDASQFKALQMAVNFELAVIQGPPGTGKTYVGHQIARLLLANEQLWNPAKAHPMLVVCYTNHALDQFLEGIAEFVTGAPNAIVRVGGQCKNENLQQFLLHKVRNSDSSGLPRDLRAKHYLARESQRALSTDMTRDGEIIAGLGSKIVKLDQLRQSMSPQHQQQFTPHGRFEKCRPTEVFIDWLTLVGSVVSNAVQRQVSIGQKMNAPLVRNIMLAGMPEFAAKNATYLTGSRSDYHAIRWFLAHGMDPNVNEPIPEVQHWPSMEAVDELVEMGFADDVAVDALVAQRGNVQQAQDFLRRQFGQQQLADEDQQAPAQEEREIIDAGLYDDDHGNDYFDEDDVVIVDAPKVKVKVEDMFESDAADENWTMVGFQDDRKDRTKRYQSHILEAVAMKEEEANEVEDIWALPLHRRWSLYQYWVNKIRNRYMLSLHDKELQYGEVTKRVKEIRAMADVDLLRSARVIGMTTTGAAKHQATLRAIQPCIVIMEEAAEVLEAHLVTSLTDRCQHAILIGDHKQLRPNPAVYELAKKYGLDVSLFERLVDNGFPYASLAKQHRMRPEIARCLMPHFYEDLEDDESVKNYPHVRGVARDMVFLNHSIAERTDHEIKSHSNSFEAEFAVRLTRYLIQQDYLPEQITVLCAYMDQMLQTRQLAKDTMGVAHGVRIEVVDNYQGEESDIIILSLVRSNNPDGKIGFLSVPNRVCVALSRAKIGLYCLANIDFLAEHCDMWRKIRQSLRDAGAVQNSLPVKCEMHGFEQTIATAKEFDTKCPEGGCRQPCNGRLDCGHMCGKPCHAYDPQHERVVCTKPCTRTCPSPFKHPCAKRCDQKCDACKVSVMKELPCGHKTNAACHLEVSKVVCKVPCKEQLPCGHVCAERCSQPCTKSCKVVVQRRLRCGHLIDMRCFDNPESFPCTALVSKVWPNCGHRINVSCSTSVEGTPCPQPCNKPLPGCDHLCKGTCGSCRQGRLHIRCDEKCSRILVCGHECGSDCSKSCPPCTRPCETVCTHSRCGKIATNDGVKLRGSMATEYSSKKKKHGRQEKGRLCGDPCPPCAEKCPNSCEHHQCDLLCFQPCSKPLCTDPCKKTLKCGTETDPHMCLGVCGEPCPSVCRVCTPDQYAQAREVFFGDEDDDDARFVELVDCHHLIEAKGMNEWVRRKVELDETVEDLPPGTEKTEIVTIDCPRCKMTMRRSLRYSSTLNKRALDIEQIKLLVRGDSKDNLDLRRNELMEQLSNFISALAEGQRLGAEKSQKAVKTANLMQKSIRRPDKKDLTAQNLTMWRNVIQLLGRLSQLYAEEIDGPHKIETIVPPTLPALHQLSIKFLGDGPRRYLIADWDFLIDLLTDRFEIVSESMIHQFSSELQRLSLLTETAKWISQLVRSGRDVNSDAEQLLTNILQKLNGAHDIKDEIEDSIRKTIEELYRRYPSGLALTCKERMQILSALGSAVTKWYKCSKGHIYGIGDCGMANQRAICPECSEDIGGESHRLVSSSQDAPEMIRGDANEL